MTNAAKTAMKEDGIVQILHKNRATQGFYSRLHKFQRKSVEKWKGKQLPAKLLALPLSFDDETRIAECGNVILSLLKMASILQVDGNDKSSIKLTDNYKS
jgi:hypothetical protein